MKKYLLNLLFPVSCIICDNFELKSSRGLCKLCHEKLDSELINSRSCKYCGRPLQANEELCFMCKDKISSADGFFTAGYYEGILKQVIKHFKYKRKIFLKHIAGEILIRLYMDACVEEIDAIIPVSLSKKRKKFRGYNQSELLAGYLSKKTGIKLKKNVLKRKKETQPQVKLDREKRFSNLKEAFVCSDWVKGKNILLVDDVSTTGATIQNSSIALKSAGADKVFVLILAHGK
ncbi:MAG: ComF family protein [Elusimicrobiota bacterium]